MHAWEQEGSSLRQLARGEQPHLFRPIEPEFTLSESIELDTPVKVLDALSFSWPICSLNRSFCCATAHALATLASITITLTLDGGTNSYAHRCGHALPSNDRQMWLKLAPHLDLEAHQHAECNGNMLSPTHGGARPAEPQRCSLVLFSPQLPEPARLDVTLARLRAIVGEENIGRPVLGDTHAQEGFHMEAFPGSIHSCMRAAQPQRTVASAQRRIRPAETISMTLRGDRPMAFYFPAGFLSGRTRIWPVGDQRRMVEDNAVGR